jgi:hypothetical protein|tara:strand:- start:563 stop:790 length:228 start_codon:yes stop_codon:yes gene_type:complete
MLDKFHHIRKLNGLYDVAVEHQNNEIRLHTADVGLVLSDINKLLSLVVNGQLEQQLTQEFHRYDDKTPDVDGGYF